MNYKLILSAKGEHMDTRTVTNDHELFEALGYYSVWYFLALSRIDYKQAYRFGSMASDILLQFTCEKELQSLTRHGLPRGCLATGKATFDGVESDIAIVVEKEQSDLTLDRYEVYIENQDTEGQAWFGFKKLTDALAKFQTLKELTEKKPSLYVALTDLETGVQLHIATSKGVSTYNGAYNVETIALKYELSKDGEVFKTITIEARGTTEEECFGYADKILDEQYPGYDCSLADFNYKD